MMNFRNSFLLLVLMLSFLPLTQANARSMTLVRDTEIENILREWGTPIFKAAGLDPKAVQIILVQSDQINAFVAGGSNIFFYTGLISKTETPGELIGVLAHETGHIAGGHLIRSREAMERASYESIVGTIIGVGAAIATGEGGALPAIAVGGSSVAQRRFFAHSRIQESSADQAALSFLEDSGINPSGMASFMEKLKNENFVPENQQSEYVRTHPLVDSRVQALQRRIESSVFKDKAYPEKWNEQHARMKAKLVGFTHPGQIPWLYDDKDTSIAAQYARAIAAYRNNSVEEALGRIDKLLAAEPNNPYFLELKGQMLVDFGRVEQAQPYYKKSIEILPNASLLRIAYAHAMIESAKNNERDLLTKAVSELERAFQTEKRSSRIHRLLATAYGRLGQNNKAKLHLAEEAVLQREYSYAEEHARAVLSQEAEGSDLWIQAQDIISFIETAKKG